MGSPRFKTVDAHGFLVTEAWFPPSLRLPPHSHDRACLAVMLEGSFDVQFTRITHACPPCGVVIEPAGERHGNRIEGAGAHVLVVQPDPARSDLAGSCADLLDRITHFRHGGITGLAMRLARELESPDAVTPLALEAMSLEMLALAARRDDGGPAARRPPAWLARATDLLHSRFLDGLRATDVAVEVGVHPVHLTRVFRAHYGVSLGAYVRGLRLDWAARRLARSQDALGDIALEAGFADQSHFTRAFKRHTGSTPDRFRRRVSSAR